MHLCANYYLHASFLWVRYCGSTRWAVHGCRHGCRVSSSIHTCPLDLLRSKLVLQGHIYAMDADNGEWHIPCGHTSHTHSPHTRTNASDF